MGKNKSGIRSFFSSVQLAIVLLALIAFVALIGTIVPQREAADDLISHMSPGLFSFLHKDADFRSVPLHLVFPFDWGSYPLICLSVRWIVFLWPGGVSV